jgi:hypothetical protein
MTGQLPGTRPTQSSFHFAWPKAMRNEEKKVGQTILVATLSRFHRGRLDGKQIALTSLTFHLVPNLQVATLARTNIPVCQKDRLDEERDVFSSRAPHRRRLRALVPS